MPFKACLFDLYGTLLDLQSVLVLASSPLGELAPPVLSLWRQKQLEYSWVETLRGTYRDFASLTEEALSYALSYHGVKDHRIWHILNGAYEQLSPYADVKPWIVRLQEKGLVTGILSNGNPAMMARGLVKSGLENLFHPVLSVDAVKAFKPSPNVYRYACDHLGLDKQEILYVSANSWDAAGAHRFGFTVVRLLRNGLQPTEYGLEKIPTIKDLAELEPALGRAFGK